MEQLIIIFGAIALLITAVAVCWAVYREAHPKNAGFNLKYCIYYRDKHEQLWYLAESAKGTSGNFALIPV